MAISSLTFIGIQKSSGVATGSGVNDQTNAELILDFVGTLTGNYTNNGDPLDFTSAAPSGYQLPSVAPTSVQISELGVIGTALPGFQYDYVYGPSLAAATPQGGAVQIFGTGAVSGQGGTQITAGAYANTTPSLNNQQIKIRAFFAKVA